MSSDYSNNNDWESRLKRVKAAADSWIEWLGRPHDPPPGSPLYGDDQLHEKKPVSQAALQGLISATDHLSLLVDAAQQIGPRPTSHYTLARASLFAAARTVWVLKERGRDERRKRALWVAFEDTRQLRQMIECSALHNPDKDATDALNHVDSEMAELKELATSKLALTLTTRRGIKPSDTAIIEESADYLAQHHGVPGREVKLLWRIHSGHAHGLGWPTLLKRPKYAEGPNGQSYRLLEGDLDQVAEAAAAATLVTNKAFELFELRSRPA